MSTDSDLKLSKHFCSNWEKRVGKQPTQTEILEFMRHSVKVQPCRDLREQKGGRFRMLAIYWHPDLDLVIKFDSINNVAVTVLSRDNLIARQPRRKQATRRWAGPRRRRLTNGSYVSLSD